MQLIIYSRQLPACTQLHSPTLRWVEIFPFCWPLFWLLLLLVLVVATVVKYLHYNDRRTSSHSTGPMQDVHRRRVWWCTRKNDFKFPSTLATWVLCSVFRVSVDGQLRPLFGETGTDDGDTVFKSTQKLLVKPLNGTNDAEWVIWLAFRHFHSCQIWLLENWHVRNFGLAGYEIHNMN